MREFKLLLVHYFSVCSYIVLPMYFNYTLSSVILPLYSFLLLLIFRSENKHVNQ